MLYSGDCVDGNLSGNFVTVSNLGEDCLSKTEQSTRIKKLLRAECDRQDFRI